MAWKIEFDEQAAREFRKLDRAVQRRIQRYLRQRIMPAEDPLESSADPLSLDCGGIVWEIIVSSVISKTTG
ncbi:MAG: hypothetical protein ABIH23_34620 [bacterium]